MEKALALQIMDAIQAAETQVNSLEALSAKITDDDERTAFRRHLREVMIGYIDIQMSIARQYPDLDPDRKLTDEGADQSIKRRAIDTPRPIAQYPAGPASECACREISMEKALAAKIMEAALSLGKEIGNLDSLISQLDNGAEKEEFIQALGNIMSVLTRDVMFRIIRDHPELDPDR